MKDFEVITINIGYFIFDFTSVWDWKISFHLFPIFKKWCEDSDTKISTKILLAPESVIFNGSAEKMGIPTKTNKNPNQTKTPSKQKIPPNTHTHTQTTKKQTSIFANLIFSENVDNKNNLEMLQWCHLYVYVSVINTFVLVYGFPAWVAGPWVFHNLSFP